MNTNGKLSQKKDGNKPSFLEKAVNKPSLRAAFTKIKPTFAIPKTLS